MHTDVYATTWSKKKKGRKSFSVVDSDFSGSSLPSSEFSLWSSGGSFLDDINASFSILVSLLVLCEIRFPNGIIINGIRPMNSKKVAMLEIRC